MASSKVARRRQGSLGLPKDSPPPAVNGSASPAQSLDNLEMLKTIGQYTFFFRFNVKLNQNQL